MGTRMYTCTEKRARKKRKKTDNKRRRLSRRPVGDRDELVVKEVHQFGCEKLTCHLRRTFEALVLKLFILATH